MADPGDGLPAACRRSSLSPRSVGPGSIPTKVAPMTRDLTGGRQTGLVSPAHDGGVVESTKDLAEPANNPPGGGLGGCSRSSLGGKGYPLGEKGTSSARRRITAGTG